MRFCLEERLATDQQSFSGVQFHGEESPTIVAVGTVKVIKAFRLKERTRSTGYERFSGGFLFARFLVGGLWRLGNGFSVGMARRARRLQADSFGRAERGQCRGGDPSICVRSASMFAAAWKHVRVSRIMANSKNLSLLPKVPDRRGHFGPYGGRYVAETLMPALTELEQAYAKARRDAAFGKEFQFLFDTNTPAEKRRFILPSG